MRRITLLLTGCLCSTWAMAALSPEQQTLNLSKHLKPFSDEEWQSIAGPRISEKYDVSNGDTLYDISQKLFGDSRYWPKLWALNNSSISNPHQINPGNALVFMPGSGSSLPAVNVAASASASDAPSATTGTVAPAVERPRVRSQEWKKLSRQSWEVTVPPRTPQLIDTEGFNRDAKFYAARKLPFSLSAIAVGNEFPLAGEIIRTPPGMVTTGRAVFLKAYEGLQVGKAYTLTEDPVKLRSSESDRSGYSYRRRGQIKIISQRDDYYVGRVIGQTDYIKPELILVDADFTAKDPTLLAGPEPLEAYMLIDPTEKMLMASQHSYVFVDRGSKDRIAPGMVFRAYEPDGVTILANLIVLKTTEEYSIARISYSSDILSNDTPVRLLTDISDMGKNYEVEHLNKTTPNMSAPAAEFERRSTFHENAAGTAQSADDLDSQDRERDGYLTEQDKRELEQLEKANPQMTAPAPTPAPETVPASSEQPPETPSVEAPMEGTPAPAPETAPAPEATPATPTDELAPLPPPADATPSAPPTAGPPVTETPAPDDSSSLDQLLNQ